MDSSVGAGICQRKDGDMCLQAVGVCAGHFSLGLGGGFPCFPAGCPVLSVPPHPLWPGQASAPFTVTTPNLVPSSWLSPVATGQV